VQRTNVNAFMKASVDNARTRLYWIAHKTILATFPRRRFFSVIVALDVLVEIGAAAAKNRVVVGRQRKIHSRGFSLRHGRCKLEREKREQRCKKRSHQKKISVSAGRSVSSRFSSTRCRL